MSPTPSLPRSGYTIIAALWANTGSAASAATLTYSTRYRVLQQHTHSIGIVARPVPRLLRCARVLL